MQHKATAKLESLSQAEQDASLRCWGPGTCAIALASRVAALKPIVSLRHQHHMQLWAWTMTDAQLSALVQGQAPLHYAAQCNSVQTVDVLTSHTADINSRNLRVSLSHDMTCWPDSVHALLPELQHACIDARITACMH